MRLLSLTKFMIFFVLPIFSAALFAAAPRLTNEPAGVISFETSFVDFGSIKRGHKMTAKFPFKNSGSGPLIIQGVQAPCDCTTVEASKGKPIGPGESGVIEVSFDSTDYFGRVTKAVIVVTNERAMSDRTLTISALVNSDIESDPPLVDFGEIALNNLPLQQVKIRNLTKGELKIEKLRYNEEFLDANLEKDGKDWLLKVKFKQSVPLGFFKDTVFVKNSSPSLPELPIPVRATIKGQISTSPAYIEFGSIANNDKSSRNLALSSTDGFEVTANKVELLVNGVKKDGGEKLIRVAVAPGEKNNKKVSLELTNPGNSPGSVHGKVFLETNNAQQKNLTIDFYAFFR